MKKLFFLIIIVTATIVSQAQDKAKKTPEDKAHKKTTEMVTALKLTKEQEKMLYSTNLKAYQSIAAYEAKKPSKKLKKKQKDVVQKLRNDEFKKILTPAQYKEYQRLDDEEDKKKDAEKKAEKQEKKKTEESKPKENKKKK
jgi:hypothetical protein